jgi:hypothetical protein
MTDTSTAETTAASTDWNAIVHSGPAQATEAAAPGVAPATITLPDLPLVVGRLPIKCDTGKAIIRLPEAIKGVSCAAVFPNTSVLSDCYKPAGTVCLPNALRARPLNDREIEVILDGGDGVVSGPGWKETGYPGGQLETRPIDFGVPFVEVLLVAGRTITCGCDSEKWASDGWGQP